MLHCSRILILSLLREDATMSNEVYDQWLELAKNAAEPMLKLNELSARTLEKMARQQFDMARDYMDFGARQVQLLSEAKDPAKWVQTQGEMATELSKKMMARADELVQLATETQKEMSAWAESTAKAAPGS
jgi:phasin family protein